MIFSSKAVTCAKSVTVSLNLKKFHLNSKILLKSSTSAKQTALKKDIKTQGCCFKL